MYKIEIPVPQGTLSFGPRSIGDIGADVLALKIAIGLVRPPDSQRNRELLVSSQQAAEAQGFSPQLSQDRNKWFDCTDGTVIDVKRAATFDIRTKNAVTRFQLDNLFMIYYYYFITLK